MTRSSLTSHAFAALFTLATLGLIGCSGPSQATLDVPPADPNVVARYDGNVITLDAFEAQYARSVGDLEAARADSMPAYEDFLERYVNFRLKVREAEALGLHQDAEIMAEVITYRNQLARPYLLENAVIEPLVRDLYEKKQLLVDASHILLRAAPGDAPRDTLAVYNKIAAIRDSVMAGADFGDMAYRHSQDPSAQGPANNLGYRGRLSYFSGGRMVQAFEDQAFSTPVGEVSPIFRTQYGYHILYVHDIDQMVPDIRLSHLLLKPAGPTPADTAAAVVMMDSLRTLIVNGADFADLANRYSADQVSVKAGGDIGFVSYDAAILPALKTAAFELEDVGDLSQPIQTRFGIHLIRLTDRAQPKSYEDSYEDLKHALSRLPRAQAAEMGYAAKRQRERGLQVDSALVRTLFADVSRDSVNQWLAGNLMPDSVRAMTFATMGDSVYTIDHLTDYARTIATPRQTTQDLQVFHTIDRYLVEATIDYEVAALEERDEQFRITMSEFRDGLLLFRLMEDSVWTAAAQDSAGLQAYFEAHQGDYNFPERTRLIGFYSETDSLLQSFADRLAGGTTVATLVKEAEMLDGFRVDTTRVAGTTSSVFDNALAIPEGSHTGPHAYSGGYVVLVRDGQEPARAKTFAEARAEVINAYQQVLEDRLVARLRAKFNAQTYPQHLTAAYMDQPASGEASSEGR